MDCMRPAVSRARRDLLRLDRLDQLRLRRVGLGVENVNSRGAQIPARAGSGARYADAVRRGTARRCTRSSRNDGARRRCLAPRRGRPLASRSSISDRVSSTHSAVVLAVGRRRIERHDVAELLAAAPASPFAPTDRMSDRVSTAPWIRTAFSRMSQTVLNASILKQAPRSRRTKPCPVRRRLM